MRKVLLLSFLSMIITSAVFSQDNYWSTNNENRNAIATDKAVARLSYPKEYKLFNLTIAPLRQQLFSVVDKTIETYQRSLHYQMRMVILNNLKFLKLQILNLHCRLNFLRSGLFPAKALLINLLL